MKSNAKKEKIAYQIDYFLNGKRFRRVVAHDKRTATLIQAKYQNDLIMGIHVQ